MSKRKSKNPPATPAPVPAPEEAAKPAEQVEAAPAAVEASPAEADQEAAPSDAPPTEAAPEVRQDEPAAESPAPEQGGTGDTDENLERDSGGTPVTGDAVDPTIDTEESGGTPVEPVEVSEEVVQESGGTPGDTGTEEETLGPVIQRREAAVGYWVEKQGWGPTETAKLIASVPDLVDAGWVWQCNDGTREFIAADIPSGAAAFKDAVAELSLSKKEHHWFLWNERLRDV